MADNTDLAMGSALAGGAIAVATIEALFDKGILTLDEARSVLDRAMRKSRSSHADPRRLPSCPSHRRAPARQIHRTPLRRKSQ